MNDAKHYVSFYYTDLGKKILEKEAEYISKKLSTDRKVLSVGCGPALIEARILELNPQMELLGLDNSKEMLDQASNAIKILGDATKMGFKNESFDAVVYIASLEFIDNYKDAIKESVRILKPKGKILILMLNPKSNYFQREYSDKNSYIRKNIKHMNIEKIEKIISRYFFLENEYFLGIKDDKIFNTIDPKYASLYIMKGIKI
jgi:ubiquinone/menaquinone biosynthesis C-methylase UbiE